MQIERYENISNLKYHTKRLLNSMFSPLCGVNQEIGYFTRTNTDMKLMIGSGALTGMHVLFNTPNPGRGAYHIGGTGILPNESMIRILAESMERYAQLMSNYSLSNWLNFTTYIDLIQKNEYVLAPHHLSLYSDQQLSRTHFPFQAFSNHRPCSWVKMFAHDNSLPIWVPAQLVLIGYKIRAQDGEPWITSAVTTGTASHINYTQACKAALLELIQLDTLMGHWYTNWSAYQIKIDHRLINLRALINRSAPVSHHQYLFYYIPNADLIGFTIACLYLQNKDMPKVVIGLGADMSLETAMYKAFLETVASVGLARMLLFKSKYEIDSKHAPIAPEALYDLDSNVEYYAKGENFKRIEQRFLNMPIITASDLPPDILGNSAQHLQKIVHAFEDSHKKLYYLDLTGHEEKSLGLNVVRFWSPHTLDLCLPSAPPIQHERFKQYGGIQHEDPHPYP